MHHRRTKHAWPTLLAFLLTACALLPASTSPTPPSGSHAQAWAPSSTREFPVLLAAGDIADCASDGDEATAALLEGMDGVLALGDLAYENGTAEEFANCYGPTWGRLKGWTIPTPGNHEYGTPGATPYFAYFGAPGLPGEGWHARAFGDWTVVALNSNCDEIGGCGPGSAQAEWFNHFLTRLSGLRRCVVAIWHHPRWSSGVEHGSDPAMNDLWRQAYEGGVELVLSGHDHQYERFVPMDAEGAAAPDGMVQFVVGTGGRSLYEFAEILPTSAAHDNSSYGVLKLTLRPGAYDWEFVSAVDTGFADAGASDCR